MYNTDHDPCPMQRTLTAAVILTGCINNTDLGRCLQWTLTAAVILTGCISNTDHGRYLQRTLTTAVILTGCINNTDLGRCLQRTPTTAVILASQGICLKKKKSQNFRQYIVFAENFRQCTYFLSESVSMYAENRDDC